jgi:hypothetical protein
VPHLPSSPAIPCRIGWPWQVDLTPCSAFVTTAQALAPRSASSLRSPPSTIVPRLVDSPSANCCRRNAPHRVYEAEPCFPVALPSSAKPRSHRAATLRRTPVAAAAWSAAPTTIPTGHPLAIRSGFGDPDPPCAPLVNNRQRHVGTTSTMTTLTRSAPGQP